MREWEKGTKRGEGMEQQIEKGAPMRVIDVLWAVTDFLCFKNMMLQAQRE